MALGNMSRLDEAICIVYLIRKACYTLHGVERNEKTRKPKEGQTKVGATGERTTCLCQLSVWEKLLALNTPVLSCQVLFFNLLSLHESLPSIQWWTNCNVVDTRLLASEACVYYSCSTVIV